MDKLPPIPTPPGTALRELRVRIVPFIAFACVAAAMVFLWRGYVGPSSWVGEVQMVRTVVSAVQPSRLTKVRVGMLDRVTAGQPVADLIAADPRYLEAQAALSRARLEMVVASVGPRIRLDNNLISYTTLRMNWLRHRVDLAEAKARLAFAEAEADRALRLSKATNGVPFVSQAELQMAQRNLDALRAEIAERQLLVQDVGGQIEKMGPDERRMDEDVPASIEAALAVEQRALEAVESQLNPTVLLSPIDGFVSVVHRQSGEAVQAGEPILTISSARAEKIIAYVRQPLQQRPQVGMAVDIRSRSEGRMVARGEVLSVGGQLEPILPELLSFRPSGLPAVEYGLPVLLTVPPELGLIPGEVVDLSLAR
ncbi:MAG: HlyD family efflux transporter periplasmic adaptor subunit [Verrucomicrobiota bacterium]|jgi:multidrug resistance efflux pump